MEILTKVKLVAGEGMYLTKKNSDVNQEPMMLKVADLNSAENKDDWTEITIREGDAIMAQWQAEQDRKMREEDARMQEEMNKEEV
jgi:co-chaperonin GroES (HSP10)